MKLNTPLRVRLILSHMLVSLLSIVLIASFAGNAIFSSAEKDVESNLVDLAFAAGNALESPVEEMIAGQRDPTLVQHALMRFFANHPELQYTLYMVDGTPVFDSTSVLPEKANAATNPEVIAALQSDIGEADRVTSDAQGERVFYVAVRIQRNDTPLGVLRLGTQLQPALAAARRVLYLLGIVSLLVVVAVSLFGWLLALNIARPVQNLTGAAERFARGELSVRVTPNGPQELRRLAEAFNVMAGRLQDHVVELRAFVANASHELRTPLTIVKLRAEALRDGALKEPSVAEQFVADIDTEVDRLGRMVNDLLDLSRMEAGLASQNRALLNLGALVEDVYETFSIRAQRAGLELTVNTEPDLPLMMGNEDQIRRVLYNFMDNAIKYTPRGGRVDVLLRSGRKGKTVRLLVKDTGPGISVEDLPHIFERFYRVEATRPRYGNIKGSGLGLAIAKTIVEFHGGKIGVSSQLGKGSTFWAELPAHTG
jgi:signal transduction histidine kinase